MANDSAETQRRLLEAAFETLRAQGFRGATARNIAAIAGCNQAAIYYHFGGIPPLLVASLTASGERRLAVYKARLTDVTDIPRVLDALNELHAGDVESGHLAVLTELVGGVTAEPALAPGLAAAIRPWLDFVSETATEATRDLPFGRFVPAAEVADTIFSLILGMQLQAKLDGDQERFTRTLNMGRLVIAAISMASAAPELRTVKS